MSKAEKLERIRESILKQPLQRRWRIKKREQSAYARYQLIEFLYNAKEPVIATIIAFRTGKSLTTSLAHLRVLVDNKIVCDRIDRLDGQRYFTVCPVCPLKEQCNEKLEFWLKSGLMEAEPLPSEQFFEEAKE